MTQRTAQNIHTATWLPGCW